MFNLSLKIKIQEMAFVPKNQVVFQQPPHNHPPGQPPVYAPRNIAPNSQAFFSPFKPKSTFPNPSIVNGHQERKEPTQPASRPPAKYEPPTKEKFKEMTEDLAKLKKQLNEIVKDTDYKKRAHEERKSNKSSDNYYAPYQRMPQPSPSASNLSQALSAQNQIENLADDNSRILKRQKSKPLTNRPNKAEPSYQKSETNYYESVQFKTNIDPIQEKPQENKRIAHLQNPNKREKSRSNGNVVHNFENSEEKKQYKNTYHDTEKTELNQSQSRARKIEQNLKDEIDREKKKNIQKELQFQKTKLSLQERIQKLSYENKKLFLEKEFLSREVKEKTQRINQLMNKNKEFYQKKESLEQKDEIWKIKVAELEKEVVQLKSESRKSFDHVLKDQLDEISTFKFAMEKKDEEIAHLNEVISLNRRKTEEAINDANIDKLKYATQIKQKQQMHEIELLNKENEIKTLKHALETIESKLQAAIRDNRSKDDFLQKHLVGRIKAGEEQEYVKNMLKRYEIQYPVNKIAEKLLQEQRQISELRKKLSQRE